jgi:hypothetical protein
MKTSVVIFLASLATSVLSAPSAEPNQSPADVLPSGLVTREQCFHPGECGWAQSGQCEYHCDGYGGFMYMQGCGWGRKRCCCAKKS